MKDNYALPLWIQLDSLLEQWLLEDIGRGDRSGAAIGSLCRGQTGTARWTAKAPGILAGMPVAERVFQAIDKQVEWTALVDDGQACAKGEIIAQLSGPVEALLVGERTALNLVMRLSGIATATRQYADRIADLPAKLTNTRKTTPGLRLLEKYASRVGGAIDHRMGLDDAAMLKDNHIAFAGGIVPTVKAVRQCLPYPLAIEVETESLEQVQDAINSNADIIMLDNMSLDRLREAIALIRQQDRPITVEASGNITLETIRAIAETGVDYISTSAPISRAPWLDLSMKSLPPERR